VGTLESVPVEEVTLFRVSVKVRAAILFSSLLGRTWALYLLQRVGAGGPISLFGFFGLVRGAG
jgi:hypothetical protein